MAKHVLIATRKPFSADARQCMISEMERAGLRVSVLESYAAAELVEAVRDVHGLIVRSDEITADIMAAAPELELVVRAGAGFDTIDVPCAEQRGIVVENTPGQNANAVAELALELMLASVRPLDGRSGSELKGKTLGVHGFGNIGRIVAGLGRACGMHVRAYDMNMDARRAREYRVETTDSAAALYAGADVVSLHIPETAGTRQSVTRALMGSMAEAGVLVNTARAGVIHEEDLLRVFEERPGFRYATDVSPGEGVRDALLARFADRVIITPKKQGAQTAEANLNAGLAAARQTVAYFSEGDTTFCVYKLLPAHLKDYAKLAVQLGKLNAAFVPNAREIQVTAYGELYEFRDTLAEYVLKGLFTPALGEQCTPNVAARYADDHGVRVAGREPDNARGYGNALTIDFTSADGATHGSRGRIDEGQMEASRIGEFKARMPLDPGLYVIASYREGPGMADRVGHLLTDNGYNRVRLGAGPNMDNTKAQAFFQVEKCGASCDEQREEIERIAAEMQAVDGVHAVKVIDLA